MKIIIDTNIINKDYKLQGKYIVTLSGAAAKLGYDVCVPEVVVDEIVSHYKDELAEAYDTYHKGVSKLKKLLPAMPKSIISLRNVKIIPFNFNHSIIAGQFARILFEARKNGQYSPENRLIIPNDTKLFAQAFSDLSIRYFVTSDTKSANAIKIFAEEQNTSFSHLDIHVSPGEAFGIIDFE